MRRSALLLCLLSLALGCSRAVKLQALGLEYEPPSGMALQSEAAGPPSVARFEGGLELRVMTGTPPALDARPEDVLAAARVLLPGTVLTSTQGTLPAGSVARYELEQGSSRTLVYFLPLRDRFVLATFTAPEQDFGPLSARVERSLSTLKPLR